jgi:3-oxoacyl-[acyl-carrier protein] reductase
VKRYCIRSIDEISAGEKFSLKVEISEQMVDQYASLTGDYNPLHMDVCFARKTPFNDRVVHGMLLGSFVSTIVGMHLPGPGALWLSQNYEFLIPLRIGDTIRLNALVSRKSESQSIIFIQIEAFNQHSILVMKGEGKVKVLEREKKKMKNKELKDCNVFVTGGSRGLGAQIVQEFAKTGCEVFLNYYNSKKQAETILNHVAQTPESGHVHLIKGDVTTKEGVKSILDQFPDRGMDILIFNALSDWNQSLALDQDLSDFERALDFGLRAPFLLLKELLPIMVRNRYGRIVSILSTSIIGSPPSGFSSYNVGKKALESLTKSVAVEYGKYNVCANMVSPNMLRTDLTANTPERLKKLVEAQTPLKRLAALEEVAHAVVSLCEPHSSYINGHNLILSGGSTII